MLRRINVIEIEESSTWYVEKDKSWNLAAAILYVKKDKCVENEKKLIDMLRRIKVETEQLLFDMLRMINMVESEETTYWYVEKDKSWNLAAAIWYVKN